MKTPNEKYKRRKNYYHRRLEKQSRDLNIISNLRLIVALVGVGNMVFLYMTKGYSLLFYVSLVYVAIFIYLVIKHNKMESKKEYTDLLYRINNWGLKRVRGEWKSFEDRGEEFKDENHSFSDDLDIFGQGSLFQWINVATTYIGRKKLAEYLSRPCERKGDIHRRQEAVGELSNRLWWRQRFMAEGMTISDETKNPEALFRWAEIRNRLYLKTWVRALVLLLPAITLILIFLYFITNSVSHYVPLIALAVQAIILKCCNKERSKALNVVYKYKRSIKAYRQMLKHIEGKSFKSKGLKELKEQLINEGGHRAYQQIDRLEKIVENISNRDNAVFIFINIALLWDYQCMIALELWKEQSGIYMKTWLDTIGEIEALSSLAIIGHDNRDWVIPKITDTPSCFRAIGIAHPLLTHNSVCNDLKIEKPTRVLLITGSNMSGKSTLLRTAGINLVLAYAGASVYAKSFLCSIMHVHTCMRISDNLEKNISAFYAELLRIRDIVTMTRGRQVFFLLDEIFKGTNSVDRHEGAKTLIKKLLKDGAVGLVSTHDLELGILEEESNKEIKNYHFQEYYRDNKIHFDYKLKPGVSTTRNALYLIKILGIND